MQDIVFSINMHLNCKPVKKRNRNCDLSICFLFSNSFEQTQGAVRDLLQHFILFEDFIPFAVCMYCSLPMYSFSLSAINDWSDIMLQGN